LTGYGRIYSFRDIAALRVISVLRNQYRISLQHLRKVAKALAHLEDEKWTATTLYVVGGEVKFQEPGESAPRGVNGQYVMGIELNRVYSDTRRDVEDISARAPDEVGKIVQDRRISRNTPVIAGTRIPVAAIRHFAEAGYTIAQILQEYPRLTEKDVEAALRHRDSDRAA
jgi:uncharacterized protein (DUF433 family)